MNTATEPKPRFLTEGRADCAGLVGSFASAEEVLSAAKLLRDSDFERIDVHSPHPIHGLDAVLGLRGSLLPLGASAGAAVGLAAGLWMAWWMNAVDYPFIISGKPLFSVFPSLPVAFELAILFAAFAVFSGALVLGGLPKFSNPKFRVPAFARATNDRYLLAVDAADSRFEADQARDLMIQSGARTVDEIPIPGTAEAKLPRIIPLSAIVLLVAALVPPVLIARARTSTSATPRLSFISDMDHQPKVKAQTTSTIFADGRSMRPQVSGTIARGDLREDDRLYLGMSSGSNAAPVDPAEAAVPNIPDWVSEFPLPVDEQFVRRGRQRYDIFCATCHGTGGDGDGLVTLRALELEQGTWVRPTSLHAEPIRQQPVGQLYNTIANGVRKMPGYASQIPVKDRWAIVAYVRALQRTRTGTIDDVPVDVRPTMRELN